VLKLKLLKLLKRVRPLSFDRSLILQVIKVEWRTMKLKGWAYEIFIRREQTSISWCRGRNLAHQRDIGRPFFSKMAV
jgi:hypothetical protein